MSSSRAPSRKAGPPVEAQLQQAYVHLTSRQHSTFTLAAALGVSPATAFRMVKTLRQRGHRIISMKEGSRWFFAVKEEDRVFDHDPLILARGRVRGVKWPRGKAFNEAIDDDLYGNP